MSNDLLKNFMYRINCYQLNSREFYLTEESEFDKNTEHLKVEILNDVEDFIKKNNCKEVTNPIFFLANGLPTPDGLFSNEIFGITKEERSGIFAYIDLGGWFIHPLMYKKWIRMDRKVRDVIHGVKKVIITPSGHLEEDPNGYTGIDFLRKNIDKIKIKSTDSEKREDNIKFLEKNKNLMFMKKYLVIPAYYRDVNNDGGKVGVGEINKLYNSLLIATKSIKETQDYGLSVGDATKGRIQELILAIYDWFSGNTNDQLEGSTGLSQKLGIVKRSVAAKTSDYGTRLVLSAPELKVDKIEDLDIDIGHSAIPLSSICVNFFPYMVFHVRRFFENEYAISNEHIIVDRNTNEVTREKLRDPLIEFSDERIKEELKRFIHGYSNRLAPVEITTESGRRFYLRFKGRSVDAGNQFNTPDTTMDRRRITWCDVFYMAAVEATRDKCVLITRYPIDSCYNQFPSKIIVSSTEETEPVMYNGQLYKKYPKIRPEDIGSDTSNRFIDTLNMSNLMLGAIGGDYDGDQVSVKGVYTKEANEELINHINSKQYYVGFSGNLIRETTKESVQSLYNLTRVLPETQPKLEEIEF